MDLSEGIFWDFGKQRIPSSDAAERGVIIYRTGFFFFLQTNIKQNKTHNLKFKMDLSIDILWTFVNSVD